ncbi:cyclic nucleotide-binding protein [Pilimelia columellifera]|uniref:Peptide zinc metalloprotease protein n=1 Tax=Pilimelia columellifera subsp. columellifera TaxID=706583 RepID=A0ABN3N742_9ACTN
MAVVETRTDLWQAVAGRAPGTPSGPADADVWAAVRERLNPAKARPALRAGVERSDLVSVRNVPYVMLRSPDTGGRSCYLRLTADEARLALLMDGERTVARLVAEFARITGRLAPDQVVRVVADLAANRMLDELPVDALRPLASVARAPWQVRWGRTLLAAAGGRRMVVGDVDPLVTAMYRAGGRWLFTRSALVIGGVVALAGVAIFLWSWLTGARSLFLVGGSYVTGAAILVGLNVVALAFHELGHALAVKHAGREVPAAGFLVYFGIPSVFVDTTDVWMAGRRARLGVTAAGPAAGLALAGFVQLVGLAVPAVAPLAFVLAFAWYINTLFNLNPLLALDGYYLLMDWLEIPNLRARGLAWVSARLRRRRPSWRELDSEGRLIALYGMLAAAWLLIAVNLGLRVWTDRLAGLALGLWREGALARLLFVAVIAALAAPALVALAGWLSRVIRRWRAELAARRDASDAPRRLAALRGSVLGQLPAPVLNGLAARGSWHHPAPGQPILQAGAAVGAVFVVVGGSVDGRAPADASGVVRERVGPGGIIGLAGALSGSESSLTWHVAAGAVLLSLPASAVAAALSPLPGLPPAERSEAESLFAETPALQAMSAEDRLGLAVSAQPVILAPGMAVALTAERDAVVIASGEVTLDDGRALRRGTLIGPTGATTSQEVGHTRTPVRLWSLPAAATSLLPRLAVSLARDVAEPVAVGALGGVGVLAAAGGAPSSGLHTSAAYPPVTGPPGPPTPDDSGQDGRFERRLWWLLLSLLLVGLLLSGSQLLPGPAWAEMPDDRALLVAERGGATATVNGADRRLDPGDRAYLRAGDSVRVADRARARIVYRGGASTLLCAGSLATVDAIAGGTDAPVAGLRLARGSLIADTAAANRAFGALTLTVSDQGRATVNQGPSRHAVAGGETVVASGTVLRDGQPVAATGAEVGCATLARPPALPPPLTPSEPTAAPLPSASASASPSASPSPSPSAGASPSPSQSRPSPSPSNGPGRDRTPPRITGVAADPGTIDQRPPDGQVCGPPPESFAATAADAGATAIVTAGATATVTARVADNQDSAGQLRTRMTWQFGDGQSVSMTVGRSGDKFSGTVTVPHGAGQERGGTVVVRVTATDRAGNAATATTTIAVNPCYPRPPARS